MGAVEGRQNQIDLNQIELQNGQGKLSGKERRVVVTDTTQFPYCAIGQVKSYFPNRNQSQGTGVLIAKKYVITVAHNIYQHKISVEEHRQAEFIQFCIYRKNKQVNEKRTFKVTRKFIPNKFKVSSSIDRKFYDIALLEIQQNDFIKEEDCMQIFWTWNNRVQKLLVAGYPSDLNLAKMMEEKIQQHQFFPDIYKDSCSIIAKFQSFVQYQHSTSPGQSGSPIIAMEDGIYKLIGIHQGAICKDTKNIRLGILLTNQLQNNFHLITKWMKQIGGKQFKIQITNKQFWEQVQINRLDMKQQDFLIQQQDNRMHEDILIIEPQIQNQELGVEQMGKQFIQNKRLNISLNKQIKKKDQQVIGLNQQILNLNRQKNDLKSQIQVYADEVQSYKRQYENNEEELVQKQKIIQLLNRQIIELNNKSSEQQVQIYNLKHQNSQLEGRSRELERQILSLKKEVQQKSTQIESLNKIIIEVRTQNDKLQTQKTFVEEFIFNKIKIIDLSNSQIDDKSVQKLTQYLSELETLTLSECSKIQDLALDECLNLKSLDLSKSRIKKLELSLLSQLKYLNLQDCNQLSVLNIKDLSKIQILNLNSTSITDQNLNNILVDPSELKFIDCNHSKFILNMNLLNQHKLKSLNLAHSKVQQIYLNQNMPLQGLDLSYCQNLLRINWNECTSLKKFNLGFSSVNDIMIKEFSTFLTELQQLNLSNCKLVKQFRITSLKKLKALDLSCTNITDTQLKLICQQLPQLKQLNLSTCALLKEMKFKSCKKIEKLKIMNVVINNIQLRLLTYQMIDLEQLNLSNSKTPMQIQINGSKKLKKLVMSNLQINYAQLNQLSQLEALYLNDCKYLKYIKLDKFRKLIILDISNTAMNDGQIKKMCEQFTELQELYVEGCLTIKQIKISKCKKLKKLSFSNSGLNQLKLNSMNELQDLNLFNCKFLDDLKVNECKKLTNLDLRQSSLLGNFNLIQSFCSTFDSVII